jgi:hypothetical protein
VLTVEYVDDSEGMDAALRALDGRLERLEQLTEQMQESSAELAAVVNRQAQQLAQFSRSLNRRLDRLYQQLQKGGAPPSGAEQVPQQETVPQEELEIPERFSEDKQHQKAWQIAQVMAADLEAYYEDQVREGALYDNFFDLLQQPIEEARQTYEERVPDQVREQFDYFMLALKKLLARKRLEVRNEERPE